MTPEQWAWCDGIKAREEGRTDNPHENKDSILAQEWANGWLTADTLLPKKVVAHVG